MVDKIFEATVEEVHSGDDLMLMVSLGVDGLFKRVRARLKGVDTPSAYKTKGNTEAGAVRDTIREVTSRGQCKVLVHNSGKGGWLVTLFVTPKDTEETLNINEFLISKGYVYQNRAEQLEGS